MIKEVSNIIYVHLEKNDGGWSGDDIKVCAEEIVAIKPKAKLKEVRFVQEADSKYAHAYAVYIGEEYLGTTYVDPNHKNFPNAYNFCPPNNHILYDCEFTLHPDKLFPDNLVELKQSIEEDFDIFFKKYFES